MLNTPMRKVFKQQLVSGNKGVAALLTIVIVAAATLLMAYSASLLGLGELELGHTSQKGEEAFSVADGCMEEALRRIRVDTSYTGGSLSVLNGSCTIAVTGSGPYTITVTGTSGEYNKKIEAGVAVSSRVLTINSWEEKDD
jgi:hypothetical protein